MSMDVRNVFYCIVMCSGLFILLYCLLLSNNGSSKRENQPIDGTSSSLLHHPKTTDGPASSPPPHPNRSPSPGGYYINLTGVDPANHQFQVVSDICIESVPGSNNKTRLVVYNENVTKETKGTIVAEGYFGDAFHIPWPILRRKGPIPSHLHKKNQTLFLYFEKYPDNIFHFIHDSFRGLYGLMERLGRLNAHEGNHIIRFICAFVEHLRYREFIDRSAPHTHFGDCKDFASEKDVCFPHGVAGFLTPDMTQFAQAQLRSFGISGRCEENLIIVMNRSSRRIGNSHEIAAAIESLLQQSHFTNTSLQVIDFAQISVREQLQKISCTRLLIGVQGAGMHWHVFQPQVAAVLELGWPGWRPILYAKLARRRGLFADTMLTQNYDVDWQDYARGNGNLDAVKNMTEADKAEAKKTRGGGPPWANSNPSKFGNGIFYIQTFLKKVKSLLGFCKKKGVAL